MLRSISDLIRGASNLPVLISGQQPVGLDDIILNISQSLQNIGDSFLSWLTPTIETGIQPQAEVIKMIHTEISYKLRIGQGFQYLTQNIDKIKNWQTDNTNNLSNLSNQMSIQALNTQLTKNLTAFTDIKEITQQIDTIKNKSIGLFRITNTKNKTYNFIGACRTDGKCTQTPASSQTEYDSPIWRWWRQINHHLEGLGIIDWTAWKITPINFIQYGTERHGIIWDNVLTPTQIRELINAINKIFDTTENIWTALQQEIAVVLKAAKTIPPIKEPTLADIAVWLDDGLIRGKLAEILARLINSARAARTWMKKRKGKGKDDDDEQKRRYRPRYPRIKKRVPMWATSTANFHKPLKVEDHRKIRFISCDVGAVSHWIQKITFTFPNKESIWSDKRGTMRFFLKKGGYVIRFVRVKRGTFSWISDVYGTGYRLWAQFWKHKIVNREVFSWHIKRINLTDRHIAIPREVQNPKVFHK